LLIGASLVGGVEALHKSYGCPVNHGLLASVKK